MEFEVPAGTVAIVYFTFVEARGRVPAPREQIARALTSLAVNLLEQAEALDEAAAS